MNIDGDVAGSTLESRLRVCWTQTVPDEAVWESGNPTITYKPLRDTGDRTWTDVHGTALRPQSAGERPRDQARDYTLMERIGEGGMGMVWRARQLSLQRDVALKQIRTDLGTNASPEYRKRFLSEALVTGYLEHPNIVPVHSLEELESGEPAIAMKLVQGIGWDQLLHPQTEEHAHRARETDVEEHLRILLAVCDAVSFAHSRQILHCDLKPQNVMIGDYGEVILMDWGLALHADDPGAGGSRTLEASRMRAPAGTPAYMAREQALGDGATIGPRTDIYQLGAVLHEILTGHPPHQGKGLREVLVSAAKAVPPDYGDQVSPALNHIACTAMAARPEDRYSSVREFQQRLREYLKHRESLAISHGATEALAGIVDEETAPAGEAETGYIRFGDIRSRFRQALDLWEENEQAAAGLREATVFFARAALEQGDLRLARAQATQLAAGDEEAVDLHRDIDEAVLQAKRKNRQVRVLRAVMLGFIALSVCTAAYGFFLVHWSKQRVVEYQEAGWESHDALMQKIQELQQEIQDLRQ